jgi:hypothetical protein
MDQSNPKNYLDNERAFFAEIEGYYDRSSGNFSEKQYAFPRFVPRQGLSYFLARNEIFQKIISVHGSILDFGIYRGASFFTWLQLSAIYEPYNHIRKVIGFDSFEGFSTLGSNDQGVEGQDLGLKVKGGMAYDGAAEIQKGIELNDLNRPLGHVAKGALVPGALPESCASYLEEHEESVIALANFGLGLYEPTIEILKQIKPRLVKGSILVFEDLNQPTWPGETKALFEVFEPGEISVNRLPYCPHISWVSVGE